MIAETRQISDKPPRFEATINLHFYTKENTGWYRIDVVGMGRTEAAAEASAKALVEQAQVACKVASVSMSRVPAVRERRRGGEQ